MCVEPTLFSAPAAMLAAKFVGAKTLLHVQDLEVDAAFEVGHIKGRALRRAASFLERELLGGFDRIVTISEENAHRAGQEGIAAFEGRIVAQLGGSRRDKALAACHDAAFRAELGIERNGLSFFTPATSA